MTEVAAAVGGYLLGEGGVTINGVSSDSRDIWEGCLFAAVRGDKFDGGDFVLEALQKGAAGAMCARGAGGSGGLAAPSPGKCLCLVGNGREALLRLAAAWRSRFTPLCAAVTGSVGKSTVKECVHAVLSRRYNTLKSEVNYNNDVGVSKTLFKLDDSHGALVSELGMNAPGEIRALSRTVRPDIAVITNIGTSHIERLSSREDIARAKLEILDGMRGGHILLNADEPLLIGAIPSIEARGIKALTVGIENTGADFLISKIETDYEDNRVNFTLKYKGGEAEYSLPAAGAHNAYNAALAAAVGTICGLGEGEIRAGLENFQSMSMRSEVYKAVGFTVIADCYNSSYESAGAAFEILKGVKNSGRKIAVLADILELGEYSEPLHAKLGALAAGYGFDMVFAYGEAALGLIEAAKASGGRGEYRHFADKDSLAAELAGLLTGGDAILFKASRGMRMEEVINKLGLQRIVNN